MHKYCFIWITLNLFYSVLLYASYIFCTILAQISVCYFFIWIYAPCLNAQTFRSSYIFCFSILVSGILLYILYFLFFLLIMFAAHIICTWCRWKQVDGIVMINKNLLIYLIWLWVSTVVFSQILFLHQLHLKVHWAICQLKQTVNNIKQREKCIKST